MAIDRRLDVVLDRLREWAGGAPPPPADGPLLRRFAEQGEADALEALVARHGPMVLGLCRRVLRREQDAEDAFQATFLILARKAASLAGCDSVAGWLHTVARRVAFRTRADVAKRRQPRPGPVPDAVDDPLERLTARELCSALDEELHRLPEKYRAPLVLCCLEGKTRDEAARELGSSPGMLKGRLERGRERLRVRLQRRGLTLAAALSAAELGSGAVGAAVPRSLLVSTARLAVDVLAGAAGPSRAALLASAVLRAGVVAQGKVIGAVVLLLLAGVAGSLARPTAAPPVASQPKGRPAPAAPAQPAAGPDVPLPPGVLRRLGPVGMRHGANICGSALSPDGRSLATSSGYSVAVWDLATRRRVAFFPCDRWPRYSTTKLDFSPDGKRLGYVHTSNFACVWDLSSGKEVRRFDKEGSNFVFCQFAADGKQFALSDGKRIDFWDLTTGEVSRAVRTGESPRLLSPDGRLFLCIESNTALGLYDSRTGEESTRLAVEADLDGSENGIAFSPDSRILAVVDRQKGVQVRDLRSGKTLASFPLPETARYQYPQEKQTRWQFHLAFSADGTTLLLGTKAGVVHRWDVAGKKELLPLERHVDAVKGVHAPAGGKTVVSTGADGVIRIWDAKTGRETVRPEGSVGKVRAARSPRETVAAVGDGSGRLALWDTATGKRLRVLQAAGPAISRLAFSADGKVLAVAGADGKISLWSVATGVRKPAIVAHDQKLKSVFSMTFSPDGRSLYVADIDFIVNKAKLYELAGGKVLSLGEAIRGDFSPDGKTIAASNGGLSIGGKPDANLLFLDPTTGATRLQVSLRPRPDHGFNGLTAVRYSPDGRSLAVGLPGGEVCLCDALTGAEVKRFEAVFPLPIADPRWRAIMGQRGDSVSADSLAFSPDDKLLLTCGSDGAVRLWEVATGEKVLELTGHEGKTTYAAFDPSGRAALTCGEDGEVFVWGLRPAPTAGGKPTPEALWKDLDDRPAKAYRAVWDASESAQAVAYLGKKIARVEAVGKDRLARLIRDLGSDKHLIREAASKELAELGDRAGPALRQALEEKPDAEVRRRVGRLLAASKGGPSREELREQRAVRALELAGTVPAREALRRWAGGAPGARLTREANAALGRLERRPTGTGTE